MVKLISTTQREILDVLIRLYGRKKSGIKGDEIAKELGRSSGTIRNQMQTLRALGYVDGVPGPKGGYTPALKAYEVLNIERVSRPSHVGIYVGRKRIKGLDLQKIILVNIANPRDCKAVLTILGDTRKIMDNDFITAGPTPVNHIVVRGRVIGRDDTKSKIMIDCSGISSIPRGTVEELAAKKMITLKENDDMATCARKLTKHNINAAPIIKNGKLAGLVTIDEITKAVAQNKTNLKARDLAVTDVFTIDKSATIFDCVHDLERHGVGRLIVMDGGSPIGIITRADILMRMSH